MYSNIERYMRGEEMPRSSLLPSLCLWVAWRGEGIEKSSRKFYILQHTTNFHIREEGGCLFSGLLGTSSKKHFQRESERDVIFFFFSCKVILLDSSSLGHSNSGNYSRHNFLKDNYASCFCLGIHGRIFL